MLQQTRVAAVLEHYRAFLARFPTVEKLAAAPLESVLAAWSGLGYYRRARSLHHAAQQIVDRHGSRLPRTVPELRALPGVGRYTSAAVASIAFGVPVAVVDGNVERVISRLLAAPGQSGLLGARRIAAGAPPSGRLEPGNDGAGRHHLPAAAAPMRRVSAEALVQVVAHPDGCWDGRRGRETRIRARRLPAPTTKVP